MTSFRFLRGSLERAGGADWTGGYDLDKLIEELAKLSTEDRVRVLRAAEGRTTRRRLTWNDLHPLKGLVQLGGNGGAAF